MTVIHCIWPYSTRGVEAKFVLDVCHTTTVTELRYIVTGLFGHNDYYFLQNGKLLQGTGEIGEENIHVVCRALGGKGGFGSMLRAIGAQIEKTTNREACRDLSGRRLRDINEEQRLKSWIAQQAAREKDAKNRRHKKLEKLLQEPSHQFEDKNFETERAQMTERISAAFEKGITVDHNSQASVAAEDISKPTSSKAQKRKCEMPDRLKKKRNLLWLGDDLSASENDDSTDSSGECDNDFTTGKEEAQPKEEEGGEIKEGTKFKKGI